MTRLSRIRQWWNRLPFSERMIWCLAGICLVLSLGLKPIVEALDPEWAVEIRAEWGSTDPWGSRLQDLPINSGNKDTIATQIKGWGRMVKSPTTGEVSGAYCFGKNGIDENCLGDDVWLSSLIYSLGPNRKDEQARGDDLVLKYPHRPLTGLVSYSRIGFLCVIPFLFWGIKAYRHATARKSQQVQIEVWRAIFLASLPAALAGGIYTWSYFDKGVARSVSHSISRTQDQMLVPIPIAILLSIAVLCFLGMLWIRLRRPAQAENVS